MSSYTLKLDLSEYERNALMLLLQTERERGERAFTEDTPWHRAIVRVRQEIDGYREATEQAKAIVAAEQNNPPNTFKMLDLSTSHLPEDMLNDLSGLRGVSATERERGALLAVPTFPEASYLPAIPAEIVTIWLYARKHDCDYVLFDADADTDELLPTWDWETNVMTPARAAS